MTRADEDAAALAEALNEANLEPWYQSGIAWFGSGGILAAVGGLVAQIGAHGSDLLAYDPWATWTAVGTLLSSAGVLYRRFAPGLKPLFWRWGG